jgi:hypothetical protein
MSTSAKPPLPSNGGQTDQDRGPTGKLPVGTNMTPRGREQTVKGAVTETANDASGDGLHRRVPGRGAQNNGLV